MDQRRLSVCGNFVGYRDAMGHSNQSNMEQRRLSDDPSFRLHHHSLHYPGEFGGSESCMLKRKNSSLTLLLDSTSSIMRTASATFHCLIGSARRASNCGEPDPTIQLSPSGNSGSLYLLPHTANSNESFLSNGSYEEQRRTVTIYDGRIPTASATPTIPFELMTPLDAITQAVDDPVESFVQIVLEEPDDRPAILASLSASRKSCSPRRRHRSSSPNISSTTRRLPGLEAKFSDTSPSSVKDLFNSTEVYSQPPAIVEPMDFSFLEPVLRGESAAPPPTRTHDLQKMSPQNSSTSEDSAIDLRLPSHTITIISDESTLPELLWDTRENNNPNMLTSCLKVPSSCD